MAQSRFYENNPSSEQDANNFSNISDQKGGTCYAHAIAHAVRETENRIIGRYPPSHNDLVKEITNKYGYNGADTYQVLQWQCNKRQLGCKQVTRQQALNAIKKGRVIVGRFYLNEGQWNKMGEFFNNKSNWVYEKSDIGDGYNGADDGGHAVAIIGIGISKNGKSYFKIKNSWGNKWADNGYFRFSFDMPLQYFDVYFRICDLTKQDLDNYKQINGSQTDTYIKSQENDHDGYCVVL